MNKQSVHTALLGTGAIWNRIFFPDSLFPRTPNFDTNLSDNLYPLSTSDTDRFVTGD